MALLSGGFIPPISHRCHLESTKLSESEREIITVDKSRSVYCGCEHSLSYPSFVLCLDSGFMVDVPRVRF